MRADSGVRHAFVMNAAGRSETRRLLMVSEAPSARRFSMFVQSKCDENHSFRCTHRCKSYGGSLQVCNLHTNRRPVPTWTARSLRILAEDSCSVALLRVLGITGEIIRVLPVVLGVERKQMCSTREQCTCPGRPSGQ
jgi:hypothetical protein